MFGVKMAEEIEAPCNVDIPTRDYDTPSLKKLDAGLKRTVKAILAGKQVYIGCMGGMGRTGLFLAILAKAFGVEAPVEYVRKHYYKHAVETKEQYRFVREYQIPASIRLSIGIHRLLSQFKPSGCLTK
jgi:protein-tyrosine phosphatase